MFEINGVYYYIDMDALMAFVTKMPNNEKYVMTTTSVTYPLLDDSEEDDMPIQKEITENKTSLNENMNNLRYNFITNLFGVISTIVSDGIGNILSFDMNNLTIGQKIALNTLINAKILIKE